jgi:hypothetical protein
MLEDLCTIELEPAIVVEIIGGSPHPHQLDSKRAQNRQKTIFGALRQA